MIADALRDLYWYLTDFCINAANLLGITYVEFNFLLFLVVFPLTLVALAAFDAWKVVLCLLRVVSRR